MSEEEKSAKELMDELCNLTEQGAKAGYILAPQLDVMKERAERRGAERMYDITRDLMQRWGWLAWTLIDREGEKEKFMAEYERLKDAK